MANEEDRDGRSAVARGYVLATRVTSISLQMALPPVVGWWIDDQLGTTPWLTILGVVLGFTTSMRELLRLAKESESDDSPPKV